MIYDIRPISVRLVLDSMPLVREHYEEVSSMDRPLSPDREEYLATEDAGLLLTFGAFAGDELVGYSVNIVKRHMHYDMMTAYNAALFVHPNYRATPLGLRLMAETRKVCRQWGATLMLWHAKPESQLDQLLQRKRLKVQDIVYQEQL